MNSAFLCEDSSVKDIARRNTGKLFNIHLLSVCHVECGVTQEDDLFFTCRSPVSI